MESEIAEIVELLSLMSEVEKSVGLFYKSCSDIFQDESEFWSILSREEFLHADICQHLAKMVKQKPHEFKRGDVFPISAARTFISRLHADQHKLMAGTFGMEQALLSAYLTEQTVLESRYMNVVKTENTKCLEALENLVTATSQHREKIKGKMDEYRNKASRRSVLPEKI